MEAKYNYHFVFVCFCVFYGISTFVGYLMPNPVYTDEQFYFKQFCLTKVHSLIVKRILFQAIQFRQFKLK